MSVWFLPRFLGTFPYARFPLGALALRRLMEVCKPLSSLRTPASSRRSDSPATAKAPFSPRRALRLLWTFFEWPAASLRKARDPSAHHGRRYLDSRNLLERLAMLS